MRAVMPSIWSEKFSVSICHYYDCCKMYITSSKEKDPENFCVGSALANVSQLDETGCVFSRSQRSEVRRGIRTFA